MVKFSDDESLGKVVSKKQMFCSIGVEPLKKVADLAFAAGARKFSCLCGIDFTTADDKAEYKHFTIAFVSKIRSKIYRQANANPSQWFIFRKINPIRVDVLDKKALLVNYGFDIDKFFDSDLFKKILPQFEKYIKAGLSDAEQFKKKIEKKDVAQAKEIQRYVDAINEALPLLKSTRCNDKYWKLIDYDVRTEGENQVNEEIDKDVPKKWIDFCNELNAKIETNVKVLVGKYFKDYPDGSKLVDSIMSNIQFLMFDEDGYNEAGNLYEEYFHTVLNSNDYKLEADETNTAKDGSNSENTTKTEEAIDEEELDDKIEEAMKKIYDAEADRKEEDKKLEA